MALLERAAIHAALGEPARLAIVEELSVSDRAPKELAARLRLGSNLLAHHLDVLEAVGLVTRTSSAGDGRRKYVRLVRNHMGAAWMSGRVPRGDMLFLCTHNSARSQLAAAMWTARTGARASSAGTHPAARVHARAVSAARRRGLSLAEASPRMLDRIPRDAQVVTVCDLVHEELDPAPDWWHWSISDPVEVGSAAAFDAVADELEARIDAVAQAMEQQGALR